MPLDPYKTLGVSKTASEDEIRKAYKKLARTYHPDIDPSKEAAEKFQQVQQAYEILSDKQKRSNYDQFGSPDGPAFNPRTPPGGGRPGGGGGGPFPFGFDLEDLLAGARGGDARGPRNPFGGGFGAFDGQDQDIEITVPFQVAAEGGNYDLFLQRGNRDEHLVVKIPAGVDTGKIVRLSGQGHPGQGGGRPGDLLVRVVVEKHPWFRREGRDLLVDVPLTPTEAALGAKVEVPTLAEGKMEVTIPPGTSTGKKLRLKGKGVMFHATKTRGDLYAIVKIVLPPTLSPKAQELLKQLGEETPFNPRSGMW